MVKNMLFKTYGLFWRRDWVLWGRRGPNNAGRLEGYSAKKRNGKVVDFRDQKGIYILYDADFNIVYVGQTGSSQHRLLSRLRNHTCDHLTARWSMFSWFGICGVNEENWMLVECKDDININISTALNHMEAMLILAAEPPLNRSVGQLEKADEYLQFQPEDEDPVEKKINEILREISSIKNSIKFKK